MNCFFVCTHQLLPVPVAALLLALELEELHELLVLLVVRLLTRKTR